MSHTLVHDPAFSYRLSGHQKTHERTRRSRGRVSKFFIHIFPLFFARLNLCASFAQASSLPALQDTMVNFVEEKADTDVELVSERPPVCGLRPSLDSC